LGRLVVQKRPDRLAEEWPRLTASGLVGPARLDIYGFDPVGTVRERIAAAVRAQGASGTVTLHGEYRRAELPSLLADKDLLVLPSEWEGLPLILVEAMQQGIPFVATAAGGTAELGVGNPDVVVTPINWEGFEAGLAELCRRVRAGEIDVVRMHQWATERYGYAAVSRLWVDLLADPEGYFNTVPAPAGLA